MRRVEYQGNEYLIHTRSGFRLIDAMRERGVPVACNCDQDATSNACEVKYPKDTAFLLTPPTAREQQVLGADKLNKGFRLACAALFK